MQFKSLNNKLGLKTNTWIFYYQTVDMLYRFMSHVRSVIDVKVIINYSPKSTFAELCSRLTRPLQSHVFRPYTAALLRYIFTQFKLYFFGLFELAKINI